MREKVDSEVATDVTGNQKSHGVTAHVIGTRPYMPGEYTLGRVGPKTDAFAFGIVVIELLTSLGGGGARSLVEIGYVYMRLSVSRCTHVKIVSVNTCGVGLLVFVLRVPCL